MAKYNEQSDHVTKNMTKMFLIWFVLNYCFIKENKI